MDRPNEASSSTDSSAVNLPDDISNTMDNSSKKEINEFHDWKNWRKAWSDGKCPQCSGKYNGAQGVRVHISNAHPQLSQEMKIKRREDQRSCRVPEKISTRIACDPTAATDDSDCFEINNNPTEDCDNDAPVPSVEPWQVVFSELLRRSDSEDVKSEFDDQVEKCAQFLFQAVQYLKGPKHPNTRFYEARRAGRARKTEPGFHRTSNPMRREQRRKEAARNRYQYELIQYQYYNTRRRAVRSVLNPSGRKSCSIPIAEVDAHFRSLLETPNESVRERYESPEVTDFPDDELITIEEVREAIKGVAIDTSPGPDRVLMKAVKALKCEKLISLIATLMYKCSLVPKSFTSGRTVLIAKEGDPRSLKNWRPITIFSVLRRIIERILDRRLRTKVTFSKSQRGFVNLPGTHINASIVNGVMRSARKSKKPCVIVFLDISKAFDNISHAHLRRTLESLSMPDKLRELICRLSEDNTTQIQAGHDCTKQIPIRRGVPQGAPLSPAVFNLCIDFILKELTEESVTQEYGYLLVDGLSPITALAFADDIVLVAKDEAAASRLVELVLRGLQTIGLEINPQKSQAVIFQDGKLAPRKNGLTLLPDVTVSTLSAGEKIRYLGVDYEDEIVLDEVRVLRDLKNSLDTLANSTMLHPDQKLNVLSNFIWPALIYPLQTAPLHKLKKGFLEDVDCLIRGTVKQVCHLPMDTPNAMLYTAHKHRGLGIVKASWEAYLQSLNIAQKLERTDDPHLQHCRDLQAEIRMCLSKLGVEADQRESIQPTLSTSPESVTSASQISTTDIQDTEAPRASAKVLRQQLRAQEYRHWCALPHKGQGAEIFAEVPICNKWVTAKSGLSTSEWTTALKMSVNDCNVRANPRTASSTSHCRHCSEYETLAHVLGKCPRGELLRESRHHKVCDNIATELRARGCTVLREDHVSAGDQGSRYTDLVVVDRRGETPRGFVLDPTVRFERSTSQAAEVDTEKCAAYAHTLPIYRERFPGVTSWQVIGLLFGARGAIPRFTADTLQQTLSLPKEVLRVLGLNVLKDSIGILNHHLYTRD